MKLAPVKKTRFVTFYSFKGGVGRSMALYNCACILASSGRRVLQIDFDLEAPGLTFLVQRLKEKSSGKRTGQKKKVATASIAKPGLIELISGFVEDPKTWDLRKGSEPEAINGFINDLPVPNVRKDKEKYEGCLALIAAGRMDDAFAANLARIRWNNYPLSEFRDQLFLHLREKIAASGQFDYVLIDARTGLSEEGYISTRVMADDLVVLTGLNDQNIRGTARFLRHVDAWNAEEPDRQRRVILVETPIPENVEEALERRHKIVEGLFREELGHAPAFTAALPYHPLLALHEEPIVAEWPESSLGQAYFRLTNLVRSLAKDDADTWTKIAMEACQPASRLDGRLSDEPGELGANNIDSTLELRSDMGRLSPCHGPDLDQVQTALETLRSIDAERFSMLLESVVTVLNNLRPPEPKSIELLRWFTELEPNNVKFLKTLAYLLQEIPEAQNLDEAGRVLQRIVEIQRDLGDTRRLFSAIVNISGFHALRGRYAEAKNGLKEALAVCQEMNDRRRIAVVLQYLARLDQEQGHYKKARDKLENTLKIARELNDNFWFGFSLNRLALVEQEQGQYEKAARGLADALKIARELKNKRGESTVLFCLAKLAEEQGRYDCARHNFEETLKITRELGDSERTSVREFWLQITESLANPNAETVKAVLEAFTAIEDQHQPYLSACAHIAVIKVYRAVGDSATVLEWISKTIKLCEQYGLRSVEADARALRAMTLAEQGHRKEALEEARRANAFFDEQYVQHILRRQMNAVLSQ